MAITNTPWFIGQAGVQHSAEVARTMAYAATGGQSGVAQPGDLKVVALDTPGATVRVLTGAAAILSTYPGAGQQSYIARKDYSYQLPNFNMPTTGNRSDMIIARVYDPQYGTYADWDASQPNNFEFFRIERVQGVAPDAVEFTANYPCIPLARIDIPSGAQSILSSNIVDLRRKVNPQHKEDVLVLRDSSKVQNMSKSQYDYWPLYSGYNPTIKIPSWCTKIVAQWSFSGVSISGASTSAPVAGGIRASLGNIIENTNHTIIAQTANGRATHVHVATFDVPASLRGKNAVLGSKGYQTEGTGAIAFDAQSVTCLSVRYFEDVV